MTDYLGVNEVLSIRDAIAATYPDNESFEIMTHHGLLSALAAPRQSAFGSDAFPTVHDKAAALLFHLVQNHPFWDGNKRIASAALRLFLERNGQALAADDAELEALTVQVASGTLQHDEIAVWVRDHSDVRRKT